MDIGIVGIGVVGSAVQHGLQRIGHEVIGHDISYPAPTLHDLLETQLLFICVPTPTTDEGLCDVSIVESVVRELDFLSYRGLAVIKSTVTPGTTERIAERVSIRLAFCPEFLRERAAFTDFVENHDLLVIGAFTVDDYELVREAHGSLPQHVVHMTPTEAELSKYFGNVFNALRIVFANEFYEVATALGADYSRIKNAMALRSNIGDWYLDCNSQFRGFGGACLPKDSKAFATLVRELGLDLDLFGMIVDENEKFRPTILDGMRHR